MSPPSEPDPTTAYYDANASEYARSTLGVDVRPLYGPFLELIPAGGRILDAGCGSGRDAKAFLGLGYRVVAFDASRPLAGLASRTLGQRVEVLRFQDVSFDREFDGIWACASLLHVARSELPEVLRRLARALRSGGLMYASFKRGEGERWEGGRRFTDLEPRSLLELVADEPGFGMLKLWETEDCRPRRAGEWWVNVLLRADDRRSVPGS